MNSEVVVHCQAKYILLAGEGLRKSRAEVGRSSFFFSFLRWKGALHCARFGATCFLYQEVGDALDVALANGSCGESLRFLSRLLRRAEFVGGLSRLAEVARD